MDFQEISYRVDGRSKAGFQWDQCLYKSDSISMGWIQLVKATDVVVLTDTSETVSDISL